jgi:hypothetical protein
LGDGGFVKLNKLKAPYQQATTMTPQAKVNIQALEV